MADERLKKSDIKTIPVCSACKGLEESLTGLVVIRRPQKDIVAKRHKETQRCLTGGNGNI